MSPPGKHIPLWLLLGLIVLHTPLSGQGDRNFDRERWSQIVEGISYTGEKPSREEREQKAGEGLRGGGEPQVQEQSRLSRGLNTALKVMAVIILLVLLFFLVKAIVEANSVVRDRKLKRGSKLNLNPQEVERNPMEADLESLLRGAIEEGNYLWALRLYYLQILKELSLRNWIRWKKEKTNLEYLYELGAGGLATGFRSITHTFDRLWYGQVEIDQAFFEKVEPGFRQFLQQVRATSEQPPKL